MSNFEHQQRSSWTRVLMADRRLSAELADLLWRDPDAALRLGSPMRKVGSRSTVLLEWQNHTYVLKHYVEPTWRHRLKQTIQTSRARYTWSVAHRMADAGIATPRPVACVENRLGPLRGDSYLLYPYVEGTTLHSYLHGDLKSPAVDVNDLRAQLIDFWQRLVRSCASLADTNLRNFIVGPDGRMWVIDLDKARFHKVAFLANRSHRRGWQQLARSARRTGDQAERFVAEVRKRAL